MMICESGLLFGGPPCTYVRAFLLQNPVAHCWSEPGLFKRKFCTLCRKRLEDCLAVRCEGWSVSHHSKFIPV